MSIHFFFGYPEPDAGCPFAIWIPLEEDALMVAGVLNRGTKGYEDIESERVPLLNNEELNVHMNNNGLYFVSGRHAAWWISHAFAVLQVTPFAEWELVEILQATVETPLFRTDQEGLYNPAIANQTSEIVHPETGLFFPLPRSILSDGVKGVAVAVHNDESIQKQIMEAVVESCADLALDETVVPGVRSRWDLALSACSLIYDAQDLPMPRDIAEHNRRAIVQDAVGSQVPFVRVWTHQQLVNAVAMAQLMARDSNK